MDLQIAVWHHHHLNKQLKLNSQEIKITNATTIFEFLSK
jgi:hypothetical protein